MLEVNDISVFYDEFQVLKNVSIRVNQGELVVLLGPNGHGKSTLLKSVCGLLSPAEGTIRFDTQEIHRLSTKQIVEMGLTYISEERHLFPEMSVLKNLKLGAFNKNARTKESESLKYVLDLFPRLNERKKQLASTMSGGEARMLALARGLMSNAKFLAIDEPSLGLSPLLREEVFRTVKEINKKGMSILLVEQSSPEISDIADKIYLMEEGKIVFEGDKDAASDNQIFKEAFLGI
jgi:branched-chain amino acid transport system ATP-binding protein